MVSANLHSLSAQDLERIRSELVDRMAFWRAIRLGTSATVVATSEQDVEYPRSSDLEWLQSMKRKTEGATLQEANCGVLRDHLLRTISNQISILEQEKSAWKASMLNNTAETYYTGACIGS